MTPFDAWERGYQGTLPRPVWTRLPLTLMAVYLDGRLAARADEWCDDRNPTPNPYRETP